MPWLNFAGHFRAMRYTFMFSFFRQVDPYPGQQGLKVAVTSFQTANQESIRGDAVN